jgi:uncharacterized protein (DUF58 family)
MEKKLNLDIAEAITEFEAYMKEFSIQRIMYRIIFKGKGLEFDAYRAYAPDDDAADIDWKASIKSDQLLIKQYIEERDLKIMFVIDVSENMLFGSTEKLKSEYAAELSAALGHLILDYGDNIGFILFSNRIISEALPKKGTKQFDVFVAELSNPSNYGGPSCIGENLGFLLDYLDQSINAVIVVSDFINLKENASRNLSFFSNKFETIAIMIKDPLDKKMPQVRGEIIVEDPASKKQLIIDPSVVGSSYEKNALEQENKVKKILTDASIDFLDLTTDKDFAPLLAEFLRNRLERRDYIVPGR